MKVRFFTQSIVHYLCDKRTLCGLQPVAEPFVMVDAPITCKSYINYLEKFKELKPVRDYAVYYKYYAEYDDEISFTTAIKYCRRKSIVYSSSRKGHIIIAQDIPFSKVTKTARLYMMYEGELDISDANTVLPTYTRLYRTESTKVTYRTIQALRRDNIKHTVMQAYNILSSSAHPINKEDVVVYSIIPIV